MHTNPLPDRPTTTRQSPSRMSNETFERSVFFPKVQATSLTLRSGVVVKAICIFGSRFFYKILALPLLLQRPSSFRSRFPRIWQFSLATMSTSGTEHIKVPTGYKLHTENSAHLLLPDTNDAFLNPIQEFNRDLSVACIRVWAEERDTQKKARWLQNRQRQLEKESASKRRKCLIFHVINKVTLLNWLQ